MKNQSVLSHYFYSKQSVRFMFCFCNCVVVYIIRLSYHTIGYDIIIPFTDVGECR